MNDLDLNQIFEAAPVELLELELVMHVLVLFKLVIFPRFFSS